MLMGEMLRECGLPEDVYQVVPGSGETAQALIDEVDFVMFTGSTATGKKVMERAAETLTPVSLELGGKDPMIVLRGRRPRARRERGGPLLDAERRPDLHLHRARLRRGAGLRRVRAAVTDKVTACARARPAGPGSTDLGAMIHPPQSDIVERHVNDAVERGRARAHRRQPAATRAGTSSSRPSSSTSTTRWSACATRPSARPSRS